MVVEDDPGVRALAAATFDTDWDVVQVSDARMAQAHLQTRGDVEVILLDIGLPSGDGLEFLGRLRNNGHSDLPVLIISGRTETVDRVVGLRMGADDYIIKPFEPAELRARVDAVLRRSAREPEAPETHRFGALVISPRSRDVALDGDTVRLTPKEFDLLAFMAQHPRQVFTRDQLLTQVWGSSSEWQTTATVTEHVRKLRDKLTRPTVPCRWIATLRGVGYRFDP